MKNVKDYVPWTWKRPIQRLKWLHKAKKQRIERGYCDGDLWNMDQWFLEVIPPMLRQLAEDDLGFPEPEFGTKEEWKDWLTTLADHFEACSEVAIEDQNPYKHEDDRYWPRHDALEVMAQARLEDAFKEMGKHFHSLWS